MENLQLKEELKMNKKIALIGCTMGFVLCCYSATTNMIERAKTLYTPEIVANPQIDMQEGEYQQFVYALPCFIRSASEDEIISLETYLVSTITSLVIQVSTNEVREGVALSFLRNRAFAFYNIMLQFNEQSANTNICLDIAHYLGCVKRVQFPEDIAQKKRFVTYYNPDPVKMEEWKAKEAEWWRKRDLQHRVYSDNRSVDYYREYLLRACGATLPHCQKIMPFDAFVTFTNEIVRASNATSEEQKSLFRRLKHD